MTRKSSDLQASTGISSEASDLEALIGYNLKRAYVIVRAHFRDSLGPDAMSGRVFSALSLVVQSPQITQSALARMMGIERSGLVAIVDELEARAYLRRAAVPGDRRAQALVPTDAGRQAYARAIQEVRDHEARLFGDLTETEQQTLLRLLQKIRGVEAG